MTSAQKKKLGWSAGLVATAIVAYLLGRKKGQSECPPCNQGSFQGSVVLPGLTQPQQPANVNR